MLPRRHFLSLSISISVMILWLAFSWLISSYFLTKRIDAFVHEQIAAIDQKAVNIFSNIELTLDDMHGIPALVARDAGVIKSSLRANDNKFSNLVSTEAKSKFWSTDANLDEIDEYLKLVKDEMNEDIVYLMNSSGDCFASSNVKLPHSLVGSNYTDRDYFQQALAGKSGFQYAVGRQSNLPGMFFSAPVMLNGKVVGVAASKIDLDSLRYIVSQADSFITDEYGVIILSTDRNFEMHTFPGAKLSQLSEGQKLARYKRVDFPVLSINSASINSGGILQRLNNEINPVVMVTKPLAEKGTDLHVFRRLPEVEVFVAKRWEEFWLFEVSGSVVFLFVWGGIIFWRVRRQSDIALQASARKHQMLFEGSRDALMFLSPLSWRFTSANQSALKMFGVSSLAELYKLGPWDVSPALQPDGKPSSEQAQEALAIAMREGSYFFEWLHQRLDGTPFFANVLLTRIGEGENLFVQATVRDISERKQAIEALKQEKIEQGILIHKLGEAQSHLLQSEKMASIGQLAAGVAHEINNPIGYVYSNLGTLEKYVQDTFSLLELYEQAESKITDADARANIDDTKKKLDIAFLKEDLHALMNESKDGIIRVKSIVQNLKDFSHADTTDDWRFSDLHKGMESTLNIVNNELKYKAVLVKQYGVIPEVECLLSQLNQVFMNLLVNAAHAIEERGTITISTGQQGNEVFVKISDTGKGIAPEHINKIFEPFFTTKPVGKGTGLGLSLAYGIILKHLGRIEVESELGKGSTFCIWLPINHSIVLQE
jgi:PAS domain S-box-containing protein